MTTIDCNNKSDMNKAFFGCQEVAIAMELAR